MWQTWKLATSHSYYPEHFLPAGTGVLPRCDAAHYFHVLLLVEACLQGFLREALPSRCAARITSWGMWICRRLPIAQSR